ncbi:MAG: CHAT domain-containing protein [Proteobacteria bacterium]|nr:CHAT domain-containing protein [Pseudomonadota bacterium]
MATSRPVPDSVKVLFLAANPDEMARIRTDKEVKAIKDSLASAKYRERFEFILEQAVDKDGLLEYLDATEPQVVHFAAHGKRGELILEPSDDKRRSVNSRWLGRVFQHFKVHVRLVVFSSCSAREHAEVICQSIECVVAMTEEVADDDARTFSTHLYSSLASGKSVDHAFGRAKDALGGDDDLFVLRCRPGVDATKVFFVARTERPPELRLRVHCPPESNAEWPYPLLRPY